MGGLFVKLDEASCFRVCFVGNLFSFVKLEQSRWVQLAQLALSGPKPSDERDSGRLGGEECGTMTEEFVAGVELPVDFEPDLQAYGRIVCWRLRCLHQGTVCNLPCNGRCHHCSSLLKASGLSENPAQLDKGRLGKHVL